MSRLYAVVSALKTEPANLVVVVVVLVVVVIVVISDLVVV